jgi:hypothetical protein
MMRSVVMMCAATFIVVSAGTSLSQETAFTVTAKGSLNTSGRLFPNPNAADPISRAQSFSYADFYGVGGEVQYHFSNSNIFLGLGAEYVKNDGGRNIVASAQRVVPVEDYYRVIPVEFTAYFRIPVTNGPFSIVMGGGGGVYFGDRHYAMAGVEAPTTSSQVGYGIHVLGGFAYRVNEWFSVSADIKFRDAQFQTTNAFPVPSVKYGDIFVNLPQRPFESSIHTDGMVIQVGLGVNF